LDRFFKNKFGNGFGRSAISHFRRRFGKNFSPWLKVAFG
jgi:hypothetical protein